jgi:phage replication O-like protein O
MKKLSDQPAFQGFRFPNTTPVPDEIFDILLADLSGAEVKVLLYICRRTFGFKKESDTISLSQIASGIVTRDGKVLDHGTGLSKRHVQRALKSLEEKQAVTVHRQMDDQRVNEINTYSLHFVEGVETKSPYGRDKRFPRVGTPVSTTSNSSQETVLQPTVLNTVRRPGKTTMIHALPDIEQPKEKREYLAQSILGALGDEHSYPFYRLVAAKIPASVVRQALAEIKADGARQPARVFTYRMQQYALAQHKKTLYNRPPQQSKKRP